jgi:DNA polymerase III gamma and tau subunits C terminal
MLAVKHAVHEEEDHGVRMSSLREIVVELDAQRQIDLRYEIERYVRPAEIDFGHFRYTAAPGAPHDLSAKIKAWLEKTSGVEWDVLQASDGAAESTVEKRVRNAREKLENAAAHPRIAAALKAFPGSKVLRVDGDDMQDEDDDAPSSSNVIHVDFAAREAASELPMDNIPIDPEAEEDDD